MVNSKFLRVQALLALFVLLVSTLPVTLVGASPAGTEVSTELPAKPTGLQAETEAGSLDVSLDWDDVDGATHYLVRWRVAAPGEVLNEGEQVVSSEAEITVADYGEWVVRVQACNGEGCGSPVTTRVDVDPPALLVETEPGSLDVSLDWDDVDGATRYWVRWRVAVAGEELNEGVEVVSSEAEITVADYGEWVVRVQACDDEDCGSPVTTRVEVEPATEAPPTPPPKSAPRQPESTPTPDPVGEPPGRPTGLLVETESGSLDVSLNWDDVDGADYYWVRWRVATAGEELNEGVEVESSDAEITVADYGEWVLRVQACNNADCGRPATTRVEVNQAAEATPTPTPATQPQVSITANPANPVVEEAVTLSAVIADAPSGLDPSYKWELDLSGTWFSMGTGPTFSYLTDEAESQAFRVTVSYDSGASATSAPLTVTWSESAPIEVYPSLVLTVSPDSLTEDAGRTEITVTAAWLGTATHDEDAAIALSLSGSAQDPADYTAVVKDVTIPAGVNSKTVALVVTPKEDGLIEGDETIVVTGAVGSASSSATVTLSDPLPANSPPTFDGGAGPLSRSVAENSPADTSVGAAVAATDPDDDTLAYTLTGTDAGSFTIDGDGQIEVAQGTSLDYETKTSYSVTVNVSDGKDAQGDADTAVDASVNVTINVTDVEPEPGLPPSFPSVINGVLFEGTGEVDGVLLPEAEGGEGELTYSLTGIPRGLSFDSDTRILSGTLARVGVHTLVYTVTDEDGVQASFSFTITVQSTRRTTRSTPDIDWRRPNIRNLYVGRAQYSEPTAPGLNVSWNVPDMSTDESGDNLSLADIEQYELRHSKPAGGLTYILYMSKDTRSTVLGNLVAGTNYRVDVRVKYSGDRYPEWTIFSRYTNTPPRLASGRLNPTYILEWGGADSVQTISDDFTDANGDALTYTASSTPAGIVRATIQDGGDEENPTKELRIHLLNPITGAANVTYGAHDGYGGYVFQVISVGGFSNMTRSIAENSEAGAAVGAAVTGTPYGTERLFYTLTGEASTSGAFEIDSSTGQVSVAEGASLDYETKSSYTGKVKWTVNGQAAEVNLTINVTDVHEPPLAPVNPQVTSITDTAFTVTWEAPDNTGRPAITEYELESEHPDSTVTTHTTPDGATYSISLSSLAPGTTYDLTLRARNDEGDGAEAEFTGATLDYRPRSADFTKYFRDGGNASFARGDFPFSSDEDDDVLASVKFTSIPTSEGAFNLRQSDGNLSNVAANSLIAAGDLGNLVFVPVTNFDGEATARFKVIDQEGDESGSAYTLTLDEVVNIPPSFGAGPLSREVPENSASGTAVGAAVTANDPDNGDTLTYSLSGTDASSFTIDSGTGQISVAAGTVLDHEATKNTYEVEVGASDGKDADGNADTAVDATITVNIAVTNVNEGAPPSVTFSLSEVGSTSMKVTVTPPDTTNTSPIKHYTVAYKAGSDFNILASPAESDGSVTLDSGTAATLTGLTPSTTYYVKVVAVNRDDQSGPEPTAQTATTGTNTAPTSANFTKQVSRQTGATFSNDDFPFTDADDGDTLSKVKIVTLPGHTDIYGKTTGVLRFDGTAATAGQEVSVDDLGKLKYVPQPNGFRVDIGGTFTFKVLDRDGAESPTYTVTWSR